MSALPTYDWYAAGFVYLHNRPPLDDPQSYNDFRKKRWLTKELLSDLREGVLVPGQIITAPGCLPGVVVDDPEGGQMIKPLSEVIV